MSGVTARTLRHYDETGVLPPARIGANGHRYHEERQLLRLQQILVLRALGVGLQEIGRILSEQVDEVDALRGHHQRLLVERDIPGLAAYQRDAIEAYATTRLRRHVVVSIRSDASPAWRGLRFFAEQGHCGSGELARGQAEGSERGADT
ncbi:hypothetical protein Snoj_52870 [Streptomyces nojiriensis]|uniref:HTH merR-type domain-containing protein n=1 Tax=Streptomyces nojiriensis TaxID=66374 RepID=A0ABQ3ST91_9ACTN|nr:HTH-type transcriptional activator TipA [Streptomyces nojiriensis]GGR92299.1 hypothetical protein GCM10010205_21110 [Streptomyces nojiriensis]GHI71369.1 hypothetical protein Snoj_52870 [Streptomyces nojiriensis]